MWLVAIIIGGGLGIFSFLVGLFYVIASISGWRRMASRFRAPRPPEGELFRQQTLYGRGRSRYIKGIDMYVAHDGLYLVTPAPVFDWAHPPLFLPWAELHFISESESTVRLGVGTPELVQIRIPRPLWEKRPTRR